MQTADTPSPGSHTVSMDELYGYMKEALRHFGLDFFGKTEVQVTVSSDYIHFTYGARSVSYALPAHTQ